MYALLKNGRVEKYPYSFQQLRADNPQVSFPADPSDEALAEWGIVPVLPLEAPEGYPTKNVEEGIPEPQNGKYYQTWLVTDATAEQVAARAELEAKRIRAKRNQLLSACDWTQLPDASVDAAAWATYRRALRDIPAQAGFPWAIVWPGSPS
jgi:hypothetical protein